MAFSQTIGSLLHNEQLRSLREQAGTLLTGKTAREAADTVEQSAPVQGLLGYLPQIMEYAGLVAELVRGRAGNAATAVAASVPSQPERMGYWRAARPYVYTAAALGAFGYAAYIVARSRRD